MIIQKQVYLNFYYVICLAVLSRMDITFVTNHYTLGFPVDPEVKKIIAVSLLLNFILRFYYLS